ncbi:hypothetical protein HanRHA438_Chr02g0085301 [Helianthus annuus]|uniref:Uncharacterized protein n=1 Tax=Helianthus annuus TaxID=4232 RepID=A0A9K3JR59_HELAN|nr:hypothetical protein HanXRQr2_Chr02g0073801 [Helianthus annuus]KAJ0605314.1 hypothetical protein HanHA300_Chr02g0061641 [Helianthus annuus]KAJ0619329.1 hypothetical protein HanHA89_Chr02g0070141 [Helianthus annuus]KAJ0940606.1 hypothetical protein HanRHA438_Chr02g0085301 [Helianthus annuus]
MGIWAPIFFSSILLHFHERQLLYSFTNIASLSNQFCQNYSILSFLKCISNRKTLNVTYHSSYLQSITIFSIEHWQSKSMKEMWGCGAADLAGKTFSDLKIVLLVVATSVFFRSICLRLFKPNHGRDY